MKCQIVSIIIIVNLLSVNMNDDTINVMHLISLCELIASEANVNYFFIGKRFD